MSKRNDNFFNWAFFNQIHLRILVITFLLFIGTFQLYATQFEDSLFQEPAKFKFGIHLGVSMNYFNYGDLEALEVASDYTFGGSFGLVFDWRLSNIYHMRFGPYYEYQKLSNTFSDNLNSSDVSFTNHNIGLNFFPIVFRLGSDVSPEISVGGYYNYVFSSTVVTTLNGRALENIEFETNDQQYGLVFGAGIFIGRKLIEVRYKKSLTDYVVSGDLDNSINQVKFVIVL
jgi:hypothetical protein